MNQNVQIPHQPPGLHQACLPKGFHHVRLHIDLLSHQCIYSFFVIFPGVSQRTIDSKDFSWDCLCSDQSYSFFIRPSYTRGLRLQLDTNGIDFFLIPVDYCLSLSLKIHDSESSTIQKFELIDILKKYSMVLRKKKLHPDMYMEEMKECPLKEAKINACAHEFLHFYSQIVSENPSINHQARKLASRLCASISC